MTTHVIMNVDRPNGSGRTYKAGVEYDLPDDLVALWRGQGVCRLTSVRSEQTGAVITAISGNFPDAPAQNKRMPVEYSSSLDGRIKNLLVNGAAVYKLKRRGNVGMRIFGGRMEYPFNDGGTAKTHHCVMTTAKHFDAVRVVLSACNAAAVPVTKLAVSVASTQVGASDNTASWVAGTFGGQANGEIPARVTNRRRTYLISDLIRISSLDRTDGGLYPLLAIRAYLGTPGTYTLLGNSAGTDDFTNWATHPSGRVHVMRYNDGDCIATPASFTNSTNRSTSPIVGVIYYARGRVVNVCGFGDSITDGRGTYKGEGWGFPACQSISTDDTAYEWSNFAWSGAEMDGSPSDGIVDTFSDALATALPIDIALMPMGSPNDVLVPPITANVIKTEMRQPFMQALADATLNGVGFIPWTWLPTNPSVKDYNSSDSLRVQHNADMRALMTNIGLPLADFEPILSGDVDADGQVQLLNTSDGIHPNDVGNALLAPEAMRVIRQFY